MWCRKCHYGSAVMVPPPNRRCYQCGANNLWMSSNSFKHKETSKDDSGEDRRSGKWKSRHSRGGGRGGTSDSQPDSQATQERNGTSI